MKNKFAAVAIKKSQKRKLGMVIQYSEMKSTNKED
jgi:hypothetical protein